LLLIAAALSALDPARATITDTGDVALSGSDLLIGNTADGSRTVDADTDGPYDSATLGVSQGVTGTLTLDTGARLQRAEHSRLVTKAARSWI